MCVSMCMMITDMDRVYIFLNHSLECVYYVLLLAYLRSTLTSSLRTLYEKKRAFTAITSVLSSSSRPSSSSFHQLLNLANEQTNVGLIEEIAKLVHKDIDFSLQNDVSSSSSTVSNGMSVNEITTLIGDKHIDGISVYFSL